MIKRICFSIIFISCLFALSLSLLGVDGPIHLGNDFRVFLTTCSIELEKWKVAIPSIPMIDEFVVDDGILVVVNFLIKVVNGLSTLINFVITLANTIIQVLEFLFIILKNFITLRDRIVVSNA